MAQKVKTRFAPSPTGFLHVGGLRTALYNYLFAKKTSGEFLLRIEDTDQSRKVTGAVENLQSVLKQFNLNWSNKEPMIQSTRLTIYQKQAQRLVKDKKAYYCFCSSERLEQLKKIQAAKKFPPMYDGLCRDLTQAQVTEKLKKQEPHVIRFRMPHTGQTEFKDLIRGQVKFDNKILDDQIILKSDGFPTYHLASVVDDNEMKITHVIRGEEWLPSTPKHILLYQALALKPPAFAHLPLLLNPDKSKLSKRQGDVAVEDYLKKGYLPESLLNFILLLGWNPGTEQEIFNLKEMIETFSLEKVNKAGAVFDTNKLDWLNGHYIRQKSLGELTKLCQVFFQQAGVQKPVEELEKVVATEKNRIKTLAEIVEVTKFFFETPQYKPKLLAWKKMTNQEIVNNLKLLTEALTEMAEKEWDQQNLEKNITALIGKNSIKTGEMLWPMRAALSGTKASPGPFEIAQVLGKKETLKRLQKATKLLKNY